MAEATISYQEGQYFENLSMRRKKPEILFKGHHVPHLPWMEYTEWDHIPLLPNKTYVPYQNVQINVEKLCHVTHDKEFNNISKGEKYVLIPRQKFGKAGYNYDGSPIGESYVICKPSDAPPNRQTQYQYISRYEKVLPGYYIWWSIDHSCIFPREFHSNLIHSIGSKVYGYYTSEPFSYPNISRYGNHKFTSSIKELLQCYQNAYGSPLPRIEFRCGGTLRYRNEICYVVIVCAVHSDSEHPLSKEEFPLWKNLEVEYINGKIVSIQINIRNGISGVYCHGSGANRKPKFYSWDTYAFALYFPDSKYRLELPKSTTTTCLIGHRFCIKTKPDPLNDFKFTCPNKLLHSMNNYDTSDDTKQTENIEEFNDEENDEHVWQILINNEKEYEHILSDSEESKKEQEYISQEINSEKGERMWQYITTNSEKENEHTSQVINDSTNSKESDEDKHLWREISDAINSDEEDKFMSQVIKDAINNEESDEDEHLWREINDSINSEDSDELMSKLMKDTLINSEDEHMWQVINDNDEDEILWREIIDTIDSEDSDEDELMSKLMKDTIINSNEEDEHMWQVINDTIDSDEDEHLWRGDEDELMFQLMKDTFINSDEDEHV